MHPPDVILVAASVRSLAEAVVRDGKIPYCVDFFADSDLRNLLQQIGAADNFQTISSYSEVTSAISNCDAKVPIVLAGGAETDTELHSQLRDQWTVAGMSSECIGQLRDPNLIFPALQAAGCSVPDWTSCEKKIRDQSHSQQWLVKDVASSGGQAVSTASASIRLSSSQFYQRQLEGICFSATYYSDNDDHSQRPTLLGFALQLSGLRALNCDGFQFCGNVGPLALSSDLQQQVLLAAEALTQNFPIHGVWGIDFILKDSKPWVIEVNPRVTASHELYERHQGGSSISHVQLQVKTIEGSAQKPDHAPTSSVNPVARMVVYASESITVSAATERNLKQFLRTGADTRQKFWVADLPVNGSRVVKGTPLCSAYLQLSHTDICGFEKMCRYIPADTSQILSDLIPEVQGQIRLLEKVSKFSK